MIEKVRENNIFKVNAKYDLDGVKVTKTIELGENIVQLFIHCYKDNVGSIMGFNIPIDGYLQYDVVLHDLEKIEDISDFEFLFLKLIKTHIYNLNTT